MGSSILVLPTIYKRDLLNTTPEQCDQRGAGGPLCWSTTKPMLPNRMPDCGSRNSSYGHGRLRN